jgi:RNA polymerase sigma-70 factor (ECF subfamily)
MNVDEFEAEFIELVNRHQGIIHRMCRVYATTAGDRQDLFQDILYHLWKSYPTFKHEAAFTTWMYRIALNTAITSLRKIKRKPQHVGIDETIENAVRTADDNGDDDIELLHQAIRKLNPVERALIMLYLEDLSHKEMSEVLGLTPSNIGVKLSRIKSKLQTLLRQQES